jgi:histidine triad (HIT) family protein
MGTALFSLYRCHVNIKNMNEEKTIFEKIIVGEIPCYKIYEDEATFAFLDNSPDSPGHTLVIPKEPYKNIYELPDDIAQKLILTVKKVSNAIKKGLEVDGINLVMNNEKAAGQIVFHAHIHIIPRIGEHDWKGKNYNYKDGEAEEITQKIIGNLD